MSNTLQSVFIFGVILPALVTILFFVGFLVCWFKCDLRQKILKKCLLRKRQPSNASSAASHSTHRIHYIKDNLDSHSAGSRDRHPSGGSSQRVSIQWQERSQPNHSNLGFELGEEYGRDKSRGGMMKDIAQVHGGPNGTYLTEQSTHNMLSSGLVQNVKDLDTHYKTESSPVNSRHTQHHQVLSDNHRSTNVIINTSGISPNQTYSPQLGNNRNHTDFHSINELCSNISQSNSPLGSNTLPRSSPEHRQYDPLTSSPVQLNRMPWGITPLPPLSDNQQKSSPAGIHNRPSTSGVENQHKRTNRRAEYVQQVFSFPSTHSHHHHTNKLISAPHASLDNSTSSNYSNSSNDGDYYHDYDNSSGSSAGDNYRQFVPTTEFTRTSSKHSHQHKDKNFNNNQNNSISLKHKKYEAGQVISAYHHSHSSSNSSAENSTDSHRVLVENSTRTNNHSHHHNTAENSTRQKHQCDTFNNSKHYRLSKFPHYLLPAEHDGGLGLYKTLGSGTGSHHSSSLSVENSAVSFVFNEDGVKIVESV